MTENTVEAGRLTIDLHALLSITRSLRRGTETALWLALIHCSQVPTRAGVVPGWPAWSIDVLKGWGLNDSAAKQAVGELRDLGYVSPAKHPDGSQFAVPGPQLAPWLAGERNSTFQNSDLQEVEDAPMSSPTSGIRRHSTELVGSGLTTEQSPHLRLLEVIQDAPEGASRSALKQLLSGEGSASTWQSWVQHPSLGTELGTPDGFADTVVKLSGSTPAEVTVWLRSHGCLVSESAIGTELVGRVVFALVSATDVLRKSPPGWLAHMAKSATQVRSSPSYYRVIQQLAPHERATRDTPDARPVRLAQVHELKVSPINYEDQELMNSLMSRIPAIAAATESLLQEATHADSTQDQEAHHA